MQRKKQSAAKAKVYKKKEPSGKQIENNEVRLNKYISEAGLVSRRKADELIAAGAVKVNKNVVLELGTKIKYSDFVTVNGDPIYVTHNHLYVLLNKPKNCITTTSDEKRRKTVMDIVKLRERVFPVGRLDRNTTGVLLLTNDGELANRLTHPRYKISRVYNAKLDKPLKIIDAEKIAAGLKLDENETSSPCNVSINPEDKSKVILEIAEGKNHEVKRIFEAVGYEVKSLDRKYYHNLSTKGLPRGKYRFLNRQEISELKKLI